MIGGHDRLIEQFRKAWDSRALHHAWLLAGPRGVGKARFARAAARRVLAEAAGPAFDAPALDAPNDHPAVKLLDAGSHPDMRWLERAENVKTGKLNRNINVEQVRALGDFMNLTPALSPWRVAAIDTVDELEASGANALLKMLEEPPPNTLFFLISHAPGRLLPTIRSRCRRLDFRKLDDEAMTSILGALMPDASSGERRRLIEFAGGSVGRAMAIAELDLAPLEEKAMAILADGDRFNEVRTQLAEELARKGASDRYDAFLQLLPSLVVRESRNMPPPRRERALAAYERLREIIAVAPRLSLDPAATVFQLGGILASAADQRVS